MHVTVLCLVAQSCSILCDHMDCSLPGSSVHGDSLGKNTRGGCHVLLQGIVPTQGSNPGLLHYRQILYHLSHQGSPRILECVAHSFSMGSSRPRDRTRVSCIAGRFFTSCATREVCEWSSWYFIVLSHIFPWRRKWQATPVFLPGEFYGQRSLAGYSQWDPEESNTIEQLTLSLSQATVA